MRRCSRPADPGGPAEQARADTVKVWRAGQPRMTRTPPSSMRPPGPRAPTPPPPRGPTLPRTGPRRRRPGGAGGRLGLVAVACGPGRVGRELARRGAQVTGGDISPALLAKARAYEQREPLGIVYVQADATARRVLEGRVFDGAVCNYGLSDI